MRGGRVHGLARGIEQLAGERCLHFALVIFGAVAPGIGIEMLLDAIEQRGIDDSLVLTFVNLTLVPYLAKVDGVAQQVKQCPATEGRAAHMPTLGSDPLLGADALLSKFALERMD